MSEPLVVDGRNQRRAKNAERIYDAAMELLLKRPYEELSVEEICLAAGVGRATYFRIFDGRAGLLKEFNRRMTIEIEERLETILENDFRLVFSEIGRGIADAWSQSTPAATAMMLEFVQGVSLADPHAAHPDLYELVIEVVRKGQNKKQVKSEFPPELLGSLALIQLSAAAGYWATEPTHDLHDLMDAAVENWLEGAAVKTGKRTRKTAKRPPKK